MLGSSNSHEKEIEDSPPPLLPPPPDDNNNTNNMMLHCQHQPQHHHQIQSFMNPPDPSSIHMRQLLIRCAELISTSDFSAAHRLISVLSSNSSPTGDSTQRLLHHFTNALSLRLHRHAATATSSSSTSTTTTTPHFQYDPTIVQSSYLSFNQITPFLRFTHLTANQAILEAIQGHPSIHILDFNIMHGVQWPPLMQALADRYPLPTLRISGTGDNPDILRRTGDRLAKFANSLGLTFQFHPILLNPHLSPLNSFTLHLLPNETLAVNCVLYLHRITTRESIRHFLHQIKSMNPTVVTLAEREASHNLPLFLQRFVEAMDHYTALFDSLEATLPPNSRDRMAVEEVWLGREIADIVAGEGENRRERHERFRTWELMMRSSGFEVVPLSPFALSQAKLLLRLHYPSEGYQLQIINNSFFLGWQNHDLFSVSSWR